MNTREVKELAEVAMIYASEHGTIGIDYEQIYDAVVFGANWMDKENGKESHSL